MRKDLQHKDFKFREIVVEVEEFDKGGKVLGTGFENGWGGEFVGGHAETVVHFEDVHDFFHVVLLLVNGHEIGAANERRQPGLKAIE
jgi:hypothetical protein